MFFSDDFVSFDVCGGVDLFLFMHRQTNQGAKVPNRLSVMCSSSRFLTINGQLSKVEKLKIFNEKLKGELTIVISKKKKDKKG